MKKYAKLIWFAVFVLIVLVVFFYWDDMARGFLGMGIILCLNRIALNGLSTC